METADSSRYKEPEMGQWSQPIERRLLSNFSCPLAVERLRANSEVSRSRFRNSQSKRLRRNETNSRNEDAKKSYPKIGPAKGPKKKQIRTGPGGAKFPDSAAVKICVLFNTIPV